MLDFPRSSHIYYVLYMYMYIHVCVCKHVDIYIVCMCVQVHCVYMHVVCVIYMYIHLHVCTTTCTVQRFFMYRHACTCTYMYMYIYKQCICMPEVMKCGICNSNFLIITICIYTCIYNIWILEQCCLKLGTCYHTCSLSPLSLSPSLPLSSS